MMADSTVCYLPCLGYLRQPGIRAKVALEVVMFVPRPGEGRDFVFCQRALCVCAPCRELYDSLRAAAPRHVPALVAAAQMEDRAGNAVRAARLYDRAAAAVQAGVVRCSEGQGEDDLPPLGELVGWLQEYVDRRRGGGRQQQEQQKQEGQGQQWRLIPQHEQQQQASQEQEGVQAAGPVGDLEELLALVGGAGGSSLPSQGPQPVTAAAAHGAPSMPSTSINPSTTGALVSPPSAAQPPVMLPGSGAAALLHSRALALLRSGDAAGAEAALQQLEAADPGNGHLCHTRGLLRQREGDMAAAEAWFRRGLGCREARGEGALRCYEGLAELLAFRVGQDCASAMYAM